MGGGKVNDDKEYRNSKAATLKQKSPITKEMHRQTDRPTNIAVNRVECKQLDRELEAAIQLIR